MNIPNMMKRSAYLSRTESRNPPNRVTLSVFLATAPSMRSKQPEIRIKIAPVRRQSKAIQADAPKAKAAPQTVNIFGLIILLFRKKR
jgi:hypothetical protein